MEVVEILDDESSVIDLIDSDDDSSVIDLFDSDDEPAPDAIPESAGPDAGAGPSRRTALTNGDLREAYDEINSKAFGGELPKDVTVVFESRLLSRGGDYHSRDNTIRISPTVCDTAHKMRSVLLHECCHVAEHHIDKAKCGHGENFLKWAKKASAAMPELDKVERLHNFKVARKYMWKCPKCEKIRGSHHLGKVKCCGVVQILKAK